MAEEELDAVMDLTTTEIADEVVGGVLSARAWRLTAATRRDISRVVSVGACDMVNFGPVESVPAVLRGDRVGDVGDKRVLHRHNPTVTLMRTTKDECVRIARLIAKNIMAAGNDGLVLGENTTGVCRTRVLLPTGGPSMLDVPGQQFWDPEADELLFAALEDEFRDSPVVVARHARDIYQ